MESGNNKIRVRITLQRKVSIDADIYISAA